MKLNTKKNAINITIFFFFRILSILTYTYWKRGEGFKETDSNVYTKIN